MNQSMILHPIAFLVHAHSLSIGVSGWLISPDGHWHLIGKADPKTHASRYPLPDKELIIRPGDVIAARCTYNNTSDRDVELGYKKLCSYEKHLIQLSSDYNTVTP
jgi:hypothetical protein